MTDSFFSAAIENLRNVTILYLREMNLASISNACAEKLANKQVIRQIVLHDCLNYTSIADFERLRPQLMIVKGPLKGLRTFLAGADSTEEHTHTSELLSQLSSLEDLAKTEQENVTDEVETAALSQTLSLPILLVAAMSAVDFTDVLPELLCVRIFRHVDLRTRCKAEATSKRWQRLILDSYDKDTSAVWLYVIFRSNGISGHDNMSVQVSSDGPIFWSNQMIYVYLCACHFSIRHEPELRAPKHASGIFINIPAAKRQPTSPDDEQSILSALSFVLVPERAT
ncbi:unnamed protein product, partial [Soboliphyme baturini]|uniref:F-box domain-containing protein n=1 Tax=Soboliphyme baturini TaxID=241478 RepID=A0A183IMW8_9BILA